MPLLTAGQCDPTVAGLTQGDGSPFVLIGTAVDAGDAVVWEGRNGLTYYLYQTRRISNEAFDEIRTPGITSRLELDVRGDLPSPVPVNAVAEVRSILQVVYP